MENIGDEKYIRSADFLNHLAQALHSKLQEFMLVVCFSQNKDELVLGFASQTVDFYIVADLQPKTGFLYFPNEYHRAKKNSADIFPELINNRIKAIHAHEGERSFDMQFENNFQLVFKMHGRNANILLAKDQKVISVFKNNLENDFEFRIPRHHPLYTKTSHFESIALANEFYGHFTKIYYLSLEKEQAKKYLTDRIKKTANYLAKSQEQLEQFHQNANFEQIANILMANLHLKIENQNTVEFHNFYSNNPISIKLKPEVSLQKNAENYYRKAKNKKLELQKITENINQKQSLLLQYQAQLTELSSIIDLKTLRNFLKTNEIKPEVSLQAQPSFPFRTFEFQGFQIWMGKNAENNDLLTLKYAFKEDLWLHAKDVSGSHVIVKHQSGKNFPKLVIEKAAEIAAFYSKRKSDTLVPVTVTPKKYVRKPKGFAAGKVIVEKEDVVLVSPKDFKI